MPGPHDPSCPCAIRRKVLSSFRSIIAYFEGERKGEKREVCVNKFSVNLSSPYSYSEMGSKIFYRYFEVDDVGGSPQANPSRPPRGQKLLYTYTREGSPPGGQTRSSLAGGSQPIALP